MTDREQVIAELLYLKRDCLEGSATDQTLDKAIALLKAQEPHVMTLEQAQGADYCWYENRAVNYCFIVSATMSASVQRNGGKPQTQLESIGSNMCGFMYDDDYGYLWRCWDKEPTDEQREATPWQ